MADHLVILHPHWLERLTDGRKTVEFRASDRRIAPWDRVHVGDRLWLKASGGPVAATARAIRVDLRGPFTAADLEAFLEELVGDPEDALNAEWRARLQSQRYVTLVWTAAARSLPPIDVRRLRGRRQDSWQVLNAEQAAWLRDRLPRGWADVLP